MENRGTHGRSEGNTTAGIKVCGDSKIVEIFSIFEALILKQNFSETLCIIRFIQPQLIYSAKKNQRFTKSCNRIGNTDRRTDIVVIDSKKNQGFVFNPTIRRKTNVAIQDEDINAEKREMYVSCIPNLRQRYQVSNQEFKGLQFDARRTSSPLLNFFYEILKHKLVEIFLTVLVDTLGII